MPFWVILMVLGVVIYTFLFGLDMWRWKNYRGAIGVWILMITPIVLGALYMMANP